MRACRSYNYYTVNKWRYWIPQPDIDMTGGHTGLPVWCLIILCYMCHEMVESLKQINGNKEERIWELLVCTCKKSFIIQINLIFIHSHIHSIFIHYFVIFHDFFKKEKIKLLLEGYALFAGVYVWSVKGKRFRCTRYKFLAKIAFLTVLEQWPKKSSLILHNLGLELNNWSCLVTG